MIIRYIGIALSAVFTSTSLFAQEIITQPQNEPTTPKVVEKPTATPPPAPVPAGVDKPSFRVGLGGAYSLAMHSTSALVLPEVPSCCGGYNEGGSGGGISAGLEFALPVGDQMDVFARVQLQTASGTMTYLEQTTVRNQNSAVNTTITHELTSTMSFLFLEPGIEYRTSGFGFVAGLRMGTLMGGTYEQQEFFTDPTIPFLYPNGTSVNNPSSGDIPQQSSFQFGLMAGMRYHLSLMDGGTLQLVPEVLYSPMFTTVVTGQSWSVNSLRAGLSLTYTFLSRERVADPLRPE